MSSREAAIRAAVHKFDGFDVREEWDVPERITATLDAFGYMELLELIFDAAADGNQIHYADECPRSRDRIKKVRQAKNVSDRRAGELAEQNRVLAAIVRDLAANGPPVVDIDPEVMGDWVCMACPDDHLYDEARHTADEVVHHEDCTWRRAVEWLQSQETDE